MTAVALSSPLTPPLDGLTAPYVAVGLRRLLTSYVGPIIKLRRASDDATQDFSAGTDGWIVKSAIDAWAGGAYFCDTLYDQSGNGRDFTQATLVRQPTLVWDALGLGRPGLYFIGAIQLDSASRSKSSGPVSMIASARRQDTQTVSVAMHLMNWGSVAVHWRNISVFDFIRGELVTYSNGSGSGVAPRAIAKVGNPGDYVYAVHHTAGGSELRVNGQAVTETVAVAGAVPAISSQTIELGNSVNGKSLRGWVSDFVLWTADMRSSLTALETRLVADYPVVLPHGYTYYPSTIDLATYPLLEVRVHYDHRRNNMPILVMMHSWGGTGDYFIDADIARFTDQGFFVVLPSMRGRLDGNLDPAIRDASGREVQDIYDAVEWARAYYPTKASQTIAYIAGWSGGGGSALMASVRFPDYWAAVVDNFGMSDYGHDLTYGWYTTDNGAYGAEIAVSVGDTPTNVPNDYLARKALDALPVNMQDGHLWMFHDVDDANVDVLHSQRLELAMIAAGNTRYTYNETHSGMNPRWLHQTPTGTNPIIQAEAYWLPTIQSYPAWTIAASGTVKVRGWIRTKRFEIQLSANKDDEAADVVYDTVAGTYLVTPLTGSMDVVITQGVLTASQTISTPTLMTVA